MLEALLDHPLTLRLGLTLAHSLWQGLVLAGLLALALLLVGPLKNRVRHALANLTLGLWLAAPLASFLVLTPPPAARATPDIEQVAPLPLAMTESLAAEHLSTSTHVETAPEAALSNANPAIVFALPEMRDLLPYAALGWLGIAALLSLRLLGGILLVRRLARSGRTLPDLQATLDDLAARLGIRRRVGLLSSTRVDVPSTVGWLRPVVLLPAATLSGLTTEQLELILAHELAHVRRHDYLVNLLQGVAEALLFYHPLTWWLSRTLRSEREHACDDLALAATGARPLALAEALARLEAGRPLPTPALAANGNLTRRVRRLLGRPQRKAPQPSLVAAGLAGALLLTVTLAALAQDAPGAEGTTRETPPLESAHRWLTIVGAIEFDGTGKAITGLAPDAWVILEERTPEGSAKITLTRGENGGVCYRLDENGRESSGCGDRSPEWFGEHLSDHLRTEILEDAPGPSSGGTSHAGRSHDGTWESFFWIGSAALRERTHDFLPPARALHRDAAYQGTSYFAQDVVITLRQAAQLRAQGVFDDAELIEALRERLEYDGLTDQGREAWRDAIENSELPEIREIAERLENLLQGGGSEYGMVFDARPPASLFEDASLVIPYPAESDGTDNPQSDDSDPALEPAPVVTSDRTRQWATLVGEVDFTPEYTALEGMGATGRLIIEERNPTGSRRVAVTSGVEGVPEYEYTVNGNSTPFDADERAWYEQLLEELVLSELRAREDERQPVSYRHFYQGNELYASLLGARHSYNPNLRQAAAAADATEANLVPELEELTQATAHGLIDQTQLEHALHHYLTGFELDVEEVASLLYAIRHFESEATKRELYDRLREKGASFGADPELLDENLQAAFLAEWERALAARRAYHIREVAADENADFAIASVPPRDDRDYFIEEAPLSDARAKRRTSGEPVRQ